MEGMVSVVGECPDDIIEEVTSLASSLCGLDEWVRWGLQSSPSYIVGDIVHQDEYSLDVLIPFRGGTTLVLDTT